MFFYIFIPGPKITLLKFPIIYFGPVGTMYLISSLFYHSCSQFNIIMGIFVYSLSKPDVSRECPRAQCLVQTIKHMVKSRCCVHAL